MLRKSTLKSAEHCMRKIYEENTAQYSCSVFLLHSIFQLKLSALHTSFLNFKHWIFSKMLKNVTYRWRNCAIRKTAHFILIKLDFCHYGLLSLQRFNFCGRTSIFTAELPFLPHGLSFYLKIPTFTTKTSTLSLGLHFFRRSIGLHFWRSLYCYGTRNHSWELSRKLALLNLKK